MEITVFHITVGLAAGQLPSWPPWRPLTCHPLLIKKKCPRHNKYFVCFAITDLRAVRDDLVSELEAARPYKLYCVLFFTTSGNDRCVHNLWVFRYITATPVLSCCNSCSSRGRTPDRQLVTADCSLCCMLQTVHIQSRQKSYTDRKERHYFCSIPPCHFICVWQSKWTEHTYTQKSSRSQSVRAACFLKVKVSLDFGWKTTSFKAFFFNCSVSW